MRGLGRELGGMHAIEGGSARCVGEARVRQGRESVPGEGGCVKLERCRLELIASVASALKRGPQARRFVAQEGPKRAPGLQISTTSTKRMMSE